MFKWAKVLTFTDVYPFASAEKLAIGYHKALDLNMSQDMDPLSLLAFAVPPEDVSSLW